MFQTLAFYATAFHRDFAAYTTARLQKLGLSFGLLFPLIYVGKHPGCSQAQLTSALGLDWGYSQRSVTRLVDEGFLTREKSGRAYRLGLSARGEEAFALSHQVFFDWDREKLASLEPEERRQLLELLSHSSKCRWEPVELPVEPT